MTAMIRLWTERDENHMFNEGYQEVYCCNNKDEENVFFL